MGISEFAVHNVLRTYSRQEGLGRAQRAKPLGTTVQVSDHVTLSQTAKKAQWLGQLATDVVDRGGGDLPAEERSARIRQTKDDLLARHRDEVLSDAVSPEDLETRLRAVYLS